MAVKQVKHSLHFVSLFMFLSKKKKNGASYSSLHTQTEPRHIFGKSCKFHLVTGSENTHLYIFSKQFMISQPRGQENPIPIQLCFIFILFFSNAFPFKIGCLDLAPVLSSFKSSVLFLFQLYYALECPLSEGKNPTRPPPQSFQL